MAHIDSLYNFAYRLTRNRDEANDLVQEASLRSYRFYHRFQKGTNFKAWAMTILRNVFINQYRQKVREPEKVSYEDFEEFISLPEMSGFEEEVLGESMQKSIDDLPEVLKTAIILFYLENLSYQEIARVMDCPMGTVMSRLHIARQMLKKKLLLLMKKEGRSHGLQ